MKKILSAALALMMAAGFMTGCGEKQDAEPSESATAAAASDYEYIKSNGKMIIGYTDYAPMNYTDKETNEFTGFDTEFAKAVCEKLGVEAEFVEIDWDNKFLALESKSIDCIWNGMTITDEVKKNASSTAAYVKNAQVVVMTKENADKYKTEDDMKDLKFAAEAGSAGAEAIQEAGFANFTEVGAQSDALLEVASGSADACVIDITMANAMTGEGTSYANLTKGIELTSEEYGIAFRKDSDLTEKVNGIMKELKDDGTLPALAEKYQLTLAF